MICLLLIGSAFIISNPPTNLIKSKAALGEQLFNEKILSKDSSLSCASCHIPAYAFADTLAFSKGVGNKLTGRNTPLF
jgi:cytochrome c peroxidase